MCTYCQYYAQPLTSFLKLKMKTLSHTFVCTAGASAGVSSRIAPLRRHAPLRENAASPATYRSPLRASANALHTTSTTTIGGVEPVEVMPLDASQVSTEAGTGTGTAISLGLFAFVGAAMYARMRRRTKRVPLSEQLVEPQGW